VNLTQEFKGRNALVTGAGRGIGKRLALGFAAAGANVGLLARSRAEIDLTQLEIDHSGGSAMRLRADVREIDQVRTAVDRMTAHFGEVGVLICSAGTQGPIGPVWETNAEEWMETVRTNLMGVVNSCSAVLPGMMERRSGKIIVLGGGGSLKPRPYFSAYAASKSAVARYVETAAEELRDHNVQINVMAPGDTYTHMTDMILQAGEKAGEKDRAEALQVRINGGTASEKQVSLAMFLASEKSNHLSGKVISVHDEWRKYEKANMHPELFTLRRVVKI
jgi:3-oxoacyl-[acyl-carrier protein] reductase